MEGGGISDVISVVTQFFSQFTALAAVIAGSFLLPALLRSKLHHSTCAPPKFSLIGFITIIIIITCTTWIKNRMVTDTAK